MSEQVIVQGSTYPIPDQMKVATTSGDTLNYIREDLVEEQIQEAIANAQQESQSENEVESSSEPIVLRSTSGAAQPLRINGRIYEDVK